MTESQSNTKVTLNSIIQDLNNPEAKIKINAIHNLVYFKGSITPDKAKKELLPYMKSCIDEEDDEVMIEIAKNLNLLLELLGGITQIKSLIPMIEFLFHSDDPLVRSETISSIDQIISHSKSFDILEPELMSLITILSTKTETADKLGLIDLISLIIPQITIDKNKQICLSILKQLESTSTSSSIKIELSTILKSISKYIPFDKYESFLTKFISDKNDAVRIPLMDSIKSLSELNIQKYKDLIFHAIITLTNDESWRVRLTVGMNLTGVLQLLPNDQSFRDIIISSFSKLLEDKDPEVKNVLCLNIEKIASILGMDPLFEKVLQKLKKIETDKTEYVRLSLASNLLKICPLIGKDKTNQYIYPMFLNMIKDESHDIRMRLVKSLDKLHEVINIDNVMKSIIPEINEISKNQNWRIRIQISETIPVLSKILSKKNFMENFLDISIDTLTDQVYIVREAGCKLIKDIFLTFKGDEFNKRLGDKLGKMKDSKNYLIRNTLNLLIMGFIDDCIGNKYSNEDKEDVCNFIEECLNNYIFYLCKDKNANVRTNCAIILKKCMKLFKNKEEVYKGICKAVDDLKKDKDNDVLYAIKDN